jgi:uncharacterized repeat protein (TIGR03803 family)
MGKIVQSNCDSERSSNTALGISTMSGFLFAALVTATLSAAPASAANFKVLHSFCAKPDCADGSAPMGDVFIDSVGTLYGTAATGGAHNGGVIYRLRFNGTAWKYETLYSFCAQSDCADGRGPIGRLIADANGNFYGVTGFGANGGTAFELMQDGKSWKLKTLYRFCAKSACKDGSRPSSGLTYDGADSGAPYDGASPLYGETDSGGYANLGVAYALRPAVAKSRWSEDVLHAFCTETADCDTTDGSAPIGGLLVGEGGDLLGVSSGGGVNFDGTIFRLTPRGSGKWKERILHAVCSASCSPSEGQSPLGIIPDGAGNFYGTTFGQGPNGEGGTLFKFAADGTFKVLYAFCSAQDCIDGHQPDAPPTLDSADDLYGTTAIGGGNGGDFHLGSGVVYRLTPSGEFSVLHAFCAQAKCRDGQTPLASVTLEANGRLIGTTLQGGKFGSGVVYELTP